MKSAIYIRQSIEKTDSLSLSGQKEICLRYIDNTENTLIFEDNGWSGKNICRPAFEKMMLAVENGEVSEIIIYRFDRISRSLNDFIKIQEKLEKHNVKLVSCSENFDTSTEIGKFMLRILIMFAEMERNSIVQRISDNYHMRAMAMKYLGGKIPFGYNLIEKDKEKILVKNEKESEIIKQIFAVYVDKIKNCEKTADFINEKCISSRTFTGSSISKTLKNVLYVKSGESVENYFKSKNMQVIKSSGDYNGYIKVKNSIYTSKHKGLISEELWIKAQEIILFQGKNKNSGKGKSSFLQGLIKCGKCGKSVYVKSNGNGTQYLQCQGKRMKICEGYSALKAKEIEQQIFNIINAKLLKTDFKIEKQIELIKKLEEKLKNISDVEKFNEIYDERNKIFKLKNENISPDKISEKLTEKWLYLEIADKKKIVREFISEMTLNDESITVFLK